MKKSIVSSLVMVFFIFACDQPYVDNRVVEYTEPPPPQEPAYVVNVDSVTGGKAEAVPLKESYAPGEYIKITAIPEEGYSFVKLSGTVETTQNPYLLSAEKDEWIIPVFSKDTEPPEEETHTVKVDTATGGTASIDPVKNNYSLGEQAKITAAPSAGYSFVRWSGTINSTESPYVFKVEKDEWIIPVFSKDTEPPAVETRTVKLDTVRGGTVSVDPIKDVYMVNEQAKITAIPDAGYSFVRWSGTINSTESPYVFKVEKDEWIIPVFSKDTEPPAVETRTVKIDTATGGDTNINPLKDNYTLNEQARITAVPDAGYSFVRWSGTVNTTENPYVFKIEKDEWIIPVFSKNAEPPEVETHTITLDAAAGGAASVNPIKSSYALNEQAKITAIPNAGYSFVKWSGTISATENPYIFTVEKDEWIIPVFSKNPDPPAVETYTVRIDTMTGGTAAIEPPKGEYVLNETVKITASAGIGYSFTGWIGTINSLQNPLTIKITTDHWIIPQFEQDPTYTLKTEWHPVGGSILASSGTRTAFTAGEKCSLQAIPSSGYQLVGWEGDIETTNDIIYITFDKDYQAYARFEKIPEVVTYTLAVAASGNGAVQRTPDKAVYYANETVRITAVPNSGSMFSSWNSPYSGEAISFDLVMNGNKSVSASFMKRTWSFIVYMAADNNLEAAAIADFNELEAVNLAGKPVSILALLDRGPGHDSTNGNWTDTRLYEIKTDPAGNNSTIISERLDCPVLGLSAASATELDMADPLVLQRLISYAKQTYAADNYGLLIWGHGTGWRGIDSASGDMPEPLKAVAIDDSDSRKYMPLKSLGSAIAGQNLSVISFDTCFGALLEIAYQIRNDAVYLVASEGLIPSNGWNYQSVFAEFLAGSDLSGSKFCDIAVNQFSGQYSGTPGSTISKIDLSKTSALFTEFESFAGVLAQSITTAAAKDTVLHAILQDAAIYRYYDAPPSDMYIDIYSFAQKMKDIRTSITSNTTLQGNINTCGTSLQTALSTAILTSWSYGGSTAKKLGVYVIGLLSDTVPMASHDTGYVKGSNNTETSAFVEASNSWAPNKVPKATSFLDKLFYWSY
jgi:hypothetical protein